MAAILPGATIGILGGGQLGRMTAMAARSLGYHLATLDPDPACAARYVVERCITASFDDAAAAAELARGAAVVTYEIEKLAIAALEAAREHAPVRPSPEILHVVQDRARQKTWLAGRGFPVGPFRLATTAADLACAQAELGSACVAKATIGGYDGRGQARFARGDDATAAFAAIGGAPSVVEKMLDLAGELSVMVARRPSGEVAIFPVAWNDHVDGILDWSVLPAPIEPTLAARATAIAGELASTLGLEGLLAVELFHTRAGDLFVNELSPRTHNTFHATEMACATSQFEQAVRAICDLPLGSVEVTRPTAIANLLGDLWRGGATPPFDRALALPGVRLHLYGKGDARPGRKMGHLSAIAGTPAEAAALVREARARLA